MYRIESFRSLRYKTSLAYTHRNQEASQKNPVRPRGKKPLSSSKKPVRPRKNLLSSSKKPVRPRKKKSSFILQKTCSSQEKSSVVLQKACSSQEKKILCHPPKSLFVPEKKILSHPPKNLFVPEKKENLLSSFKKTRFIPGKISLHQKNSSQ